MRKTIAILLSITTIAGCDRLTNPRPASGGSSVSDPSLSALRTSSGTLTPAFSSTTTSYSVAVTNDITTITVTPTAGDANAFITVNGGIVATGATSPSIALAVGTTAISVRVLSSDTTANRIYSIAVARAP